MTYTDALQYLTTEAPPEVLAAVTAERNDIIRAHLRTLGDYGRLIEQIGVLSMRMKADMDAKKKEGAA